MSPDTIKHSIYDSRRHRRPRDFGEVAAFCYHYHEYRRLYMQYLVESKQIKLVYDPEAIALEVHVEGSDVVWS